MKLLNNISKEIPINYVHSLKNSAGNTPVWDLMTFKRNLGKYIQNDKVMILIFCHGFVSRFSLPTKNLFG
jgi:hypothetical protein